MFVQLPVRDGFITGRFIRRAGDEAGTCRCTELIISLHRRDAVMSVAVAPGLDD